MWSIHSKKIITAVASSWFQCISYIKDNFSKILSLLVVFPSADSEFLSHQYLNPPQLSPTAITKKKLI